MSVYYGQKHLREVLLAQLLTDEYVTQVIANGAKMAHVLAAEKRWYLLDMSFLGQITTTSTLIDTTHNTHFDRKPQYHLLGGYATFPVRKKHRGNTVGNAPSHFDPSLPDSFVPGRNLIFLSAAVALAANLGCSEIWTGVCEADYSGYPDCREGFIRSFELAASVALGGDKHIGFVDSYYDSQSAEPGREVFHGGRIRIVTPLMHMTKAEEVIALHDMGDYYFQMLRYTHTDYNGAWPPIADNPATVLREKGFHAAGIEDPLLLCTIDPLSEYTNRLARELVQQLSHTTHPLAVYASGVYKMFKPEKKGE